MIMVAGIKYLSKALDVLNFEKYNLIEFQAYENDGGSLLSRCKYFETIIYKIDRELKLMVDDIKFNALVCIKGICELNVMSLPIKSGYSIFITAQIGNLINQVIFQLFEIIFKNIKEKKQ